MGIFGYSSSEWVLVEWMINNVTMWKWWNVTVIVCMVLSQDGS
jgi:hypothetical protein